MLSFILLDDDEDTIAHPSTSQEETFDLDGLNELERSLSFPTTATSSAGLFVPTTTIKRCLFASTQDAIVRAELHDDKAVAKAATHIVRPCPYVVEMPNHMTAAVAVPPPLASPRGPVLVFAILDDAGTLGPFEPWDPEVVDAIMKDRIATCSCGCHSRRSCTVKSRDLVDALDRGGWASSPQRHALVRYYLKRCTEGTDLEASTWADEYVAHVRTWLKMRRMIE